MKDNNNKNGKAIGRITTTEFDFSTTDHFLFWTKVDEALDLLDIIKVKRSNGSYTYGSIESIKQVSDAASHLTNFISCGFGDPALEVKTRRIEFNLITARFIFNDGNPELHTPPVNNDAVYLCSPEEIQQAMGFTAEENRIPFGIMEMYGGRVKVGVNLSSNMIISPDGAHMNISGISGLAAKTTSTMTILNAIQQKLAKTERIAFVFFNVKGEDLMAIDQPAIVDDKQKKGITDYIECFKDKDEDKGISHEPFQNVKYYRPACDKVSDSNSENYNYYFPYNKKCKENLDLIFAGDDDSSGTLESVVSFLKRNSKIKKWESLKKKIEPNKKDNNGISKQSFGKAFRIINTIVTSDSIFTDEINNGTKNTCEDLLDAVSKIKTGEVAVIDIHSRSFNEQAFVLGSVQRALAKKVKENNREEDSPLKFIIFVDELNKFAPTFPGKEKAVSKILEEIAERGRTEGTILFSAEQFRSSVNSNVIGNCSTNLHGRTSMMELANTIYTNIPPACKTMMTCLKPGEALLFSPEIISFVKVKFPYPAYKLPNSDNSKKSTSNKPSEA